MSDETTELQDILDEFEHECFMLRVEASETRARDDVVRKSYERIRDEFAGRIAVTLGSGTLTAEQVREAIEEAKAELLESCEYVGDMYQRQSDVLKAFDKMEQAIADELNAERHVETCELEYIDTYEYPDGEEDYLCKCSKCGRKSWEPAHNLPKFCGGCGRMVKR